MKVIFLLSLTIFYINTSFAQNTNLSKLTDKARNKYLLELAKEVVLNFGPDWYKDKGPFVTEISGIQVYENKAYDLPEIIKCNGRHYYTVIYRYKKYRNLPKWHFAFKVSIWEDDGVPKDILFGNDEGITFIFRQYNKWIKDGVKKEDQMPYNTSYDEEIKQYYEESEW